jgi:hypothetical protein
MYPLQQPGPDYPGQVRAGLSGRPNNPAHFWKYPVKYPALNLSDARLAVFWSLADFRGDRNIRPSFEISGQNIHP